MLGRGSLCYLAHCATWPTVLRGGAVLHFSRALLREASPASVASRVRQQLIPDSSMVERAAVNR